MAHQYNSKRNMGRHKTGVRPKHTGRHLGGDRLISESDNHSMKVEDGEYKFTLGNWTTAGWHWDGETEDAWLFLNRMRKSTVKDNLIKDMNQQEFEAFKKVIEQELEKGNFGLYGLSGDNAEWHFGQSEWVDYESEFDYYQKEYNLSDEEREKLADKTSELEKPVTFEEFEKNYGDNYKDDIRNIIVTSDSLQELMNEEKWEDLTQQMYEDVSQEHQEKFSEAVYDALDELGYKGKKLPSDQKTLGEAI